MKIMCIFGLHSLHIMCTILASDPACRAPLTIEPRLPAPVLVKRATAQAFFVVGTESLKSKLRNSDFDIKNNPLHTSLARASSGTGGMK
jgi:hypothetical protein